MAKGIRSGGVDFDDLFDPDVLGDGPSTANLRSGGVALRYAKLAYGTKHADVGYRQDGVDVSNLWAAKGTAVYQTVIGFAGLNVNIPNGWTGPSGVAYPLILLHTGNGTRKSSPTLPETNFNWTSDGNPPLKNYEAMVDNVSIPDGAPWAFTNNAATWSALNASTDRELCRLTYNANNGSVQSAVSGTARVQIRDAATGVVVLSQTINIQGTSGQS